MRLITPSQKPKVLLLENIHPLAEENLKAHAFEVERLESGLSSSELIEKAKDFHAVGIRSKTQLTQEILRQLEKLTAIGCFCIGTNQVNLQVANQLGVPVFNAPHSNTRSVAELVISLVVTLSRKLFDRSQAAHKGTWQKSASGSFEVRGKTLGIVGYGHIGSQVSVLAEAMGLKVIFYDVVKKLPLGNAQSVGSLKELLSASDFVTLHVPETEETRYMINSKVLSQMKPESYLLNLSRGTVVEIDALAEALQSHHIAGAAVDVFPKEPKNNKETFHSPLQELENVVLTPHIGGSTQEAQVAIGQEVAESLHKFLSFGSTTGAVNFPQLEISASAENTQRIINVHKNVPGVLGEINSRIAATNVNIHKQSLSTDAQIGYVVMDMESSQSADDLAQDISKLSNSLITRVV